MAKNKKTRPKPEQSVSSVLFPLNTKEYQMKHPLQIATCCVLLTPFPGAMAEGGYPGSSPYMAPSAPQAQSWIPSYSYDRNQYQGNRMRTGNPIYSDTTYYPPQTRGYIEGFNPYAGMYPETLQFRPWNDKGAFWSGNDRGFPDPGSYGYGFPASMPTYGASRDYPYPISPQRGYGNAPGHGYRQPNPGYGYPEYGYPSPPTNYQPYYDYPSTGFNPTPDAVPYGEWQGPMPPIHGDQAIPEWDYPYPEFGMPAPDFQRGGAFDNSFQAPGESIPASPRQRTAAPSLDSFNLYELPLPPALDDRPSAPATQAVAPVSPAVETVTPAAPQQRPPAATPLQPDEAESESAPEDTPPMTEETQSAPEAKESEAKPQET